MTNTLTDQMVADMDETADYMHQPASPQSAFFWQGQPSTIGASLGPHKMARSTAPKRYAYAVEGQEAGQKSAHRRDAIRRGGI